MVQNERRVYVHYEKGRAGVITTNDRKEKYTDASLSYFNMGAIHFVYNMICCNPYADANERLHLVKMEFKKQLLQFQKNVLLPANSCKYSLFAHLKLNLTNLSTIFDRGNCMYEHSNNYTCLN